MAMLRDEVQTKMEQRLSEYESNESHQRRNPTLFSYSADNHVVSVSMEATESGGGYMMPGLLQGFVWTLPPSCYTVDYVEDERTGTRADGTTPNKRIDLRIDLQQAENEHLRDLLSDKL